MYAIYTHTTLIKKPPCLTTISKNLYITYRTAVLADPCHYHLFKAMIRSDQIFNFVIKPL